VRLPDPDFWRGRRVLVTGSSGFKGSWLALMLRRLGAEVTGFALPPESDPSHFELVRLGALIDQHIGDMRDLEQVQSVVVKCQPEIVFHLAAQALVFAGFADPVGTYGSNVMGTVHLLEALRQQDSTRVLINVTTDKVYADSSGGAHREGDRLGGQGPYSASKACSELVTAASSQWAAERGLGLATARCGNTLGGGDWAANRLIPDCVRAATSGRSLSIRCPDAVRPWQFVLDSLCGYLLLAESLFDDGTTFAGAWNFAPDAGEEPRVVELAATMLSALGAPEATVEKMVDAPPETAVLRLESSKAREGLGWAPALDWRACIEWTARWYRIWLDDGDVAAESQRQLESYLSEA
jgi:CDP-glucose 4,6-dehydratase